MSTTQTLTSTAQASTDDGGTEPRADFHKRIKALKNLPPLFKMVWDSSPKIVASSLTLRLVASLLPLGMLTITRLIIDGIYQLTSHHTPLPRIFWGVGTAGVRARRLGDRDWPQH